MISSPLLHASGPCISRLNWLQVFGTRVSVALGVTQGAPQDLGVYISRLCGMVIKPSNTTASDQTLGSIALFQADLDLHIAVRSTSVFVRCSRRVRSLPTITLLTL